MWVDYTNNKSQSVTALIRPGSDDRPDIRALRERGSKTVVINLEGSTEEIAKSLEGQNVLPPAISIPATGSQIPLRTAAKLAGVKRFMPTFHAPVAPPKGAVALRDTVSEPQDTDAIHQRHKQQTKRSQKEDVLNQVKSLALP